MPQEFRQRLDADCRYFEAFGAGAPFLRAAQRAFIAAANRALPSGVSLPFFFPVDVGVALAAAGAFADEPLLFAQRALCAAAIFARAAGDIFFLPVLLPMTTSATLLVALPSVLLSWV